MADLTTPLPYGLRDVKLTPYTDASNTALGTPVDLPIARSLEFTESTDSEELKGDDVVVASADKGFTVNWSLEAGGISYEAYKVMAGGTITTSGTGNTQTKRYVKNSSNSRPYFQIEGQIISQSGGDVHVIIPRCKATGDLSGEFKTDGFFLTNAEGDGYGALAAVNGFVVGDLYAFVQNATATAIATS